MKKSITYKQALKALNWFMDNNKKSFDAFDASGILAMMFDVDKSVTLNDIVGIREDKHKVKKHEPRD